MFWMIVEVSEAFPEYSVDQRLPRSRAPRYMHGSRESAELELLRLQEECPDGAFYLLETVARVESRGSRGGVTSPGALVVVPYHLPREEEV